VLSDELIAKIGADLDVLPLQPTSRRELELLVARICGNIRAAQERGATYTEIARQISASGYPMKRSTLCAALVRHRKNAVGVKQPARHSETSLLSVRRASVATDARAPSGERSSQAPSTSARRRRQSTPVTSEQAVVTEDRGGSSLA
jgi:hypothetical protein